VVTLSPKYEEFLYGDICKYEINAPEWVSNDDDLIRVKVNKKDNVEAWAYTGTSFTKIESEYQLSEGQ
jgi:hypothetical protein